MFRRFARSPTSCIWGVKEQGCFKGEGKNLSSIKKQVKSSRPAVSVLALGMSCVSDNGNNALRH